MLPFNEFPSDTCLAVNEACRLSSDLTLRQKLFQSSTARSILYRVSRLSRTCCVINATTAIIIIISVLSIGSSNSSRYFLIKGFSRGNYTGKLLSNCCPQLLVYCMLLTCFIRLFFSHNVLADYILPTPNCFFQPIPDSL